MSKGNTTQPENQASVVIEDLTLTDSETENVKGGEGSIRVHYDTGYGNRIII
jgi:hypothetical protein